MVALLIGLLIYVGNMMLARYIAIISVLIGLSTIIGMMGYVAYIANSNGNIELKSFSNVLIRNCILLLMFFAGIILTTTNERGSFVSSGAMAMVAVAFYHFYRELKIFLYSYRHNASKNKKLANKI